MEYNQLFYNEVIFHIESQWNRRLTDHEKHILILGYNFGRQVEASNELKILEVNA